MYKNIKGVCRPDFVCEAKEMSREGTEDFPDVTDYDKLVEETGYHHIDEFCEGLLKAVKEV